MVDSFYWNYIASWIPTHKNLLLSRFLVRPILDPKFPLMHVTTFHLCWCSNSLNHDFVRLRLFQRTLIGFAMKWYIELFGSIYCTFNDLSMAFLNHFQLLICYDAGTDLLSTFCQDKSTHIFDHIQEWRRRKRLIKANIPPDFLLEWFLKYLLRYITKDVSTSGVTTKEQAIFRTQ